MKQSLTIRLRITATWTSEHEIEVPADEAAELLSSPSVMSLSSETLDQIDSGGAALSDWEVSAA